MECIDWIEAALTPEEFRGYLKGNMLKYQWRYASKGNPVQDLRKADWYLRKLLEKTAECVSSAPPIDGNKITTGHLNTVPYAVKQYVVKDIPEEAKKQIKDEIWRA